MYLMRNCLGILQKGTPEIDPPESLMLFRAAALMTIMELAFGSLAGMPCVTGILLVSWNPETGLTPRINPLGSPVRHILPL
jgi:hypothetical protein